MADKIDPSQVKWDDPPAIDPSKVQWDKPVEAKDRLQAAEGGFLRGTAYLAALPLDTVANAVNLGRAGLGTAYHAATGNDIPSALQVDSGVSPVGQWLTKQMDKSAITTTQPTHPEDAASRYLATAASVAPAILSGSSSPAQFAKGVATAAPPALAGQAVAEAKPFESDWANNAASIGTSALTAALMPRGPGVNAPGAAQKNSDIRNAQELGLAFPPATTNPTAGNRLLEAIAGKQKVAQTLSVKNQVATNAATREDMGLPPAEGPLTASDFAQAKRAAAPGYDAIRNAGQIPIWKVSRDQIDKALSNQSGAGRVAASLKDAGLDKIADEIKSNSSIDAGDAIDAIRALRDKASASYRNGESGSGAAYKGIAKALEDSIDRHLTFVGGNGADILNAYRDSRRQFAVIHSAEEAWNPSTGNVVAHDLLKQFNNNEPLSGNLLTVAKAAGLARRSNAFAEPTHSTGTSHLGLMGSLIGGAALAHEYAGSMGSAPFLATLGYQGAREGANWAIPNLAQSRALQTDRAPMNPALVAALLSSQPKQMR